MRPPDDPEVHAWVDKAAEDRDALEVLAAASPRLRSAACYHAQQCAEKALKAVLVRYDDVPPRTHDLRALLTRLAAFRPDVPPEVLAVAALTEYATLARYPGAEAPREEDVATALSLVEALWDWLVSAVG